MEWNDIYKSNHPELDRIRFRWKHLMESNQSTLLGAERSAIQVSGKFRNDNDGLIWPTEGQLFAPSGLRYAFLVVDKDHGEKPALPEDAKNWSNDSI